MSGHLEVTVGSARSLDVSEVKGKLYINIWVDGYKKLSRKTAHKSKSTSPKWEQTFQIPLTNSTKNSLLHFELIDSEDDTLLGKNSVKLPAIIKNPGKQNANWHQIGEGGEVHLCIVWKTKNIEKKERRRSGTPQSSPISSKKKSSSTLVKRAQSTQITNEIRVEKQKKTKDTQVTPNIEETRVYPPAPTIEISRKDNNDLSNESWLLERKCMMMLLEARIVLREMIDFKVSAYKPEQPKPILKGMDVGLQKLLSIIPYDDDEDSDLSKEIAELRKQLVVQVRKKQTLEKNVASYEHKITLLIMNRSSIAELDRNAKKKKKKVDETPLDNDNVLLNDSSKLSLYANLFYLLQTQPKYLARLSIVVTQKRVDSFIETTILTLFGDAFSPREEFLMLTLFKLAIQQEIQNLKKPTDLLEVDSVVPKMIITYNKRKQGKEYLVKTLSPTVSAVMDNDFDFESETDFIKVLNSFLNAIINSVDNIPYGFRLILKQMTEFMRIKFSEVTDEELGQIYGFYFYYKFLNPCIIDPSETGILTQDQVNLDSVKNLSKVGKILQALLEFRRVGKGSIEKYNSWIKQKSKDIIKFYKKLIDVKPPEDELQVDRYTELYSKQQPVIIIRLREIVDMHKLIKEHIDHIVGNDSGSEDPLRTIIKQLGDEIPHISIKSTTDTQLILSNKFANSLEPELSDIQLYDITKELIIKIFRATPIDQAPTNRLPEILAFAKDYAKNKKNQKLKKNTLEALSNVTKLEKEGLISSKDNYDSFFKAVAAELSNRALRREQQRKEIEKLNNALRELKNHNDFVKKKIVDMEHYLESCRQNLAKKIKSKSKPTKFSYKQLVKEGVIAESDVPEHSRAKTSFFISMIELGLFQIETKISGFPTETIKIQLEDLLDKKDSGESKLELDRVSLNVTPTVILMNKYFLSSR